jgi:DNA-binding NarL/FixJ family response regulator
MSIRVLLVDDHELIREGLRRAFEREPDLTVAAEAATLADGLLAVAAYQPDVVVMDLRLPDGNGMDGVRRLRAEHPRLGIVVLTMYDDDNALLTALETGASGFVSKDARTEEVIAAARHAAAMPRSFSAARLASAMHRKLAEPGPRLSSRERQVLQLLADGKAVAGIARELFISDSTVKTHISNVYEKLGAQNRAQALMTAMRLGLLSPGSTT